MATADEPPSIHVQVVYSPRAGAVDEVAVTLAGGASLLDAVRTSGLLERHSHLDMACQSFGIWGRRCDVGATVVEGDRVELYRALQVDPKDARRARHRSLLAGRRR